MLDHLGVNPLIEIHYSDDPQKVTNPNYKHKIGRKYATVDGVADDTNRVYLFVGVWKDGIFQEYTLRYIKWLLLHEMRHQYYFYNFGLTKDPWKGFGMKERTRREEKACDRFANLILGVPKRDFNILKNDKTKNRPARKTRARRKN